MVITSALTPDDAIKADAILNGGPPGAAADLVELEKALARHQDRDRARELHKKRLEIDMARALDVLSGAAAEPKEMLALAKRLHGDNATGIARRLLKIASADLKRSDALYISIHQKSTLFTYKDPDLPVEWRLDRAFEILERSEDLAKTREPESLGLAGAICKRKWEVDVSRNHLERALFFYLRGYAMSAPEDQQADVLRYLHDNPGCVLDARKDQGYSGINAAFILDLLAQLEDESAARTGMTSPASAERRESARLIREEIIRSVPPLRRYPKLEWLAEEWGFYATIGEADFGLGGYDASNYQKAVPWLVEEPALVGLERRAGGAPTGALDGPERGFESTARQLARLPLL